MPITDLHCIRAGDDVDRHVARLRIVLQQVEQYEAVDVRQAEVEGDRRRLQLARHVERACTSR